MKKIITKINNSNEFIIKAQTKWEFLKQFLKFTIDFSKTIANKRKKQRISLDLV